MTATIENDPIAQAARLCERLWMAGIGREARVARILKRAEARLQRREFKELNGCQPVEETRVAHAPASPRYRIAVQLNGNYFAPFDADQEMSERDCIARLNEQDRELSDLRETERQLRAELARRNDDVQGLRVQLATSDEHLGALLAAYQHERAALDTYEATRCTDAWENAGLDLETAEIATARCHHAARAWLRREEPKHE